MLYEMLTSNINVGISHVTRKIQATTILCYKNLIHLYYLFYSYLYITLNYQ